MMHPWMELMLITYFDDEHVDNHDYEDKTDDGHDNNNDNYARACNARVNTSISISMSIHIYIYTSTNDFLIFGFFEKSS